jgi:hypothetical protein
MGSTDPARSHGENSRLRGGRRGRACARGTRPPALIAHATVLASTLTMSAPTVFSFVGGSVSGATHAASLVVPSAVGARCAYHAPVSDIFVRPKNRGWRGFGGFRGRFYSFSTEYRIWSGGIAVCKIRHQILELTSKDTFLDNISVLA